MSTMEKNINYYTKNFKNYKNKENYPNLLEKTSQFNFLKRI